MSSFHRTLPPRADLNQQRKLAKELLAAFNRDDAEARARVRAELPDKPSITLADAQFVLAREYGFASWPVLKAHLDALTERLAETTRSPLERMKRAVNGGNAAALRRLLKQHADLRASINEPRFAFDAPALVRVADSGDTELVDVLLEFGADPNRRSDWWAGGFHPLHVATGAVADRLIAAGAVPDACAAAHLDRVDLLARMLEEDSSRVNERGGDGQTPLHFARSRAAVDLLLAHGADPDARDVDHHSTPAEWMLDGEQPPERSRRALAAYLIERGASADIFLAAALGLTDRARAMLEADPALLALRTGQGVYGEQPPASYHIYLWTIGPNFTPLQAAARSGQQETLMAMLPFASPEQRLLFHCHEGNGEEAQAIVREHPGIVEGLSGADRRALVDEAWATNTPAVELMTALGFDPSIPSMSGPGGGSALHCAAWKGSAACVAAILRFPAGRALLETRDPRFDGTPLAWCCHGSVNCNAPGADYAAVARLLVEAGARVDPDVRGCSDAVHAVLDAATRG